MWESFKYGNTHYRARVTKVYKKRGIFFKKDVLVGYFIEVEESDLEYGYTQIINDQLNRGDNDLIWNIEHVDDRRFADCLISVALEKLRSKKREHEFRINEMNRTHLIINE